MSPTVKGMKNLMIILIQGNFSKEKNMEMEKFNGRMELGMKAISLWEESKAKANSMDLKMTMKVIGKLIKCMEKVSLLGQMEINMKELWFLDIKKDMEYL